MMPHLCHCRQISLQCMCSTHRHVPTWSFCFHRCVIYCSAPESGCVQKKKNHYSLNSPICAWGYSSLLVKISSHSVMIGTVWRPTYVQEKKPEKNVLKVSLKCAQYFWYTESLRFEVYFILRFHPLLYYLDLDMTPLLRIFLELSKAFWQSSILSQCVKSMGRVAACGQGQQEKLYCGYSKCRIARK